MLNVSYLPKALNRGAPMRLRAFGKCLYDKGLGTTAGKLKSIWVSVEVISQATGLTVEEIDAL